MIKWIELADNWESVKAAARSTIGKDGHGEYPSDKWKKKILLAAIQLAQRCGVELWERY